MVTRNEPHKTFVVSPDTHKQVYVLKANLALGSVEAVIKYLLETRTNGSAGNGVKQGT